MSVEVVDRVACAEAGVWPAIEAIAGELEQVVRLAPQAVTHGVLGPDLGLFFYYLHAETGEPRHHALAVEALDHAVDALAETALPKALFDGFVRTAWTVEHLRRRGWVDAPADTCAAIDEALGLALERDEAQHFDLMSGLAGQAVYAFERTPVGAQLLEQIGARLSATATAQPGGHAWRSDPRWLAPWQREAHPEGYFDVGLTHGTPGVVRILAELAARRLAPVSELAASAVAWLLACEGEAAPSGFAYHVGGATPSESARLAWCYGDPGIALALADSARLLGRLDWVAEARRLAVRAAHVAIDRAGVHDAGICHGAAGLAHTFWRLGRATGDAACEAASRRWLAATLAMRRPDADGAGFLAFDVRRGGWVRDHSLLTGSAGVGLALLASVSAIAPAWDRVLLCSTAALDAEAAAS